MAKIHLKNVIFFLYSYQNETLHNGSTHENLKTAWLGSTCQGYGVSAYAIRIYSISVTLMCIFKFISKESCNTKKVTFHAYFYYVKFYCGRSKGKKYIFEAYLGVFWAYSIS